MELSIDIYMNDTISFEEFCKRAIEGLRYPGSSKRHFVHDIFPGICRFDHIFSACRDSLLHSLGVNTRTLKQIS